ncbi:MAG: multicopper oxidase type 2 [Geminicoccaceae bacterium]|jgi:FtsP/CotA-like multicopper oxidase with cupredoxin domain|nr:multicopper oxidase type 2 [Geminicoccaceae bacterium]
MRPVLAVALVVLASFSPSQPAELPIVAPNDNRIAAGVRRGDTLVLDLVVNRATWYPEADGGRSIVVEAFAEEGRRPQVPAPLIRVRAGTHIVATVRNALPDSTVTVKGLHSRPAAAWGDMRLAPGERHTIRFTATTPGTYLYYAVAGRVNHDTHERETTGGAFVVDPAGAPTDDRIFVVNIWGEYRDSLTYRNALAVNGKTWPHTERLFASLGDSVRYRVLNASARVHPMHLHGMYFRVDSRGNGLADTTFTPERQRLAATEDMLPATTMNMVWYADRPGNWLLHCHLAFHVIPEASLLDAPPPEAKHALSHDANVHMVGLIMGITVQPRAAWTEPPRTDPQTVRLLVHEGKRRGRSERTMGFVTSSAGTPPATDSVQIPGPVLVLTRGRPADVTVVNRLAEPTGIHWHGIELESYSDGVVGWSGMDLRLAPPIAPNDSFVARLTLPRAGTFMYHTHLGDLVQLTSGMYGAIVVLEPGQRFDPARDHVYVFGWDGPQEPAQMLVNGDSVVPPKELAAGVKHRLRFVNIGPAPYVRVALMRDTSLVRWRAVAKDGADLPPAAATERPAAVMLNVGETYDFEFDAREPGEYVLQMDQLNRAGAPVRRPQRLIVR